jgi:hypothetical protein
MPDHMDFLIWIGIGACLVQSGMFSGLNLALLGLSRLRLEAEEKAGNRDASRVLQLRRDSNFLLTTILWGNVAVNCLLTLLSGSVLAGVGAFFFSTFGITLFGEIVPQAYFSRNALRIGAALAPVVRVYQFILYPLAKPTAILLERWLGPEAVPYFRERDLREVIRLHAHAEETDLDFVEAIGALNFLALDDLSVVQEGEPVDARSVIPVPVAANLPVLPAFQPSTFDPFLQRVQSSGRKWVILTDERDEPHLVLDADGFLRSALFGRGNPKAYCHRPILVRDPQTRLGEVIRRLRVRPRHANDDVIRDDLILLWSDQKRVITGADLLGRLLRGIARRDAAPESR